MAYFRINHDNVLFKSKEEKQFKRLHLINPVLPQYLLGSSVAQKKWQEYEI